MIIGILKSEDRFKRREKDADEIVNVIEPYLDKSLEECKLLDVGCGNGRLSISLSQRVKEVKGFDIKPNKLQRGRDKAEEFGLHNVKFESKSVYEFEEKEIYDIVIMNDVIEHVPDQERALEICLKALRIEGVYYIKTNNRLWPIEAHRHLPFLSYLPRPLADKYVQLAGRGEAYDNCFLPTYIEVKDMLNDLPVSYNFEVPVNPEKKIYRFGKRLINISGAFWMFANAFQIVGKKLDEI